MRLLPVDPQTLLMLLTALPLVGLLLWVFARHCGIAIGLLLAAPVWSVAVDGQTASLDLGVRLYPADILTACALCVAAARLPRRDLWARSGLLPVLVLVALAGWSTVRGVAAFGVEAAGNDARVYFWHFLAFALYVATLPLSAPLSRVVPRAWLASAAAYVLLSVVGWLGRGLHSLTTHVAVDGVTVDPRPVPAGAALVIAQGAMLLLYPPSHGRSGTASPEPGTSSEPGIRKAARRGVLAVPAAFVLLLLVALLQHRTVWVGAAAMAFGWWLLRPARAGQRMTSAIVGAVVLSFAALLYSIGAFGSIGASLTDSFNEAQGNRSSFVWRVLGWQELLSAARTPTQWLLGSPFGSGYERSIAGGLVTVSPHDYYLHLVLRLGLVGLVALLALYVVVWRRLGRGGEGNLALRLVIIGQLVLFVAYSAPPEQAVLLGWCLWQARASETDGAHRRSLAGAPAPPPGPVPGSAAGVPGPAARPGGGAVGAAPAPAGARWPDGHGRHGA
ncbi:O-antigen ligase family protein [Streptomyces wuyuanensis]|uniref:O-antigen ligase family protein n=1 Tax=Streptomyces wuyuanensis TaxID=1196353 RepID=UPI00371C9CC9